MSRAVMWHADGVAEAFTAALVAELARRTSVCWVRYDGPTDDDGDEDGGGAGRGGGDGDGAATPEGGREAGRERAAWHVWHDDALHLVCGGTEQQLPGIDRAARAEVVLRSKDHGGRLVRWVGRVTVLRPEDPRWEPAAEALVADRLNLPDLARAKQDWAAGSVVVRIDPTGEVLEEPGRLSDEAHSAPPPPTPAATRGPLPRVLHRRRRRRPELS